jgi:Tfp pilus assembly protein PilX
MKQTRPERPDARAPAGQRGFSLVVTLILMALVMVLGLSAYKLSRTSQTLAGNVQFRGAAFSEAEAAAELAENWLSQGTNFKNAGFTTYTSGTGLYPTGYMAAHAIDPVTMTWSSTNSVTGSDANQAYLIELLAANRTLPSSGQGIGGRRSSGCNRVNTYRVVGRGQSGRGASVLVQTVYTVLSC